MSRGKVSREELKKLLERTNNLAKLCINPVEVRHEQKARRTLPERYERGEVAFHAHLRVASKWGDTESCELCATYEALAIHQKILKLGDMNAWVCSEHAFDVLSAPSDERAVKGMVPVVTCHSIQDGKKVVRRIRSIVGLQTLDECYGRNGNPCQLLTLGEFDERIGSAARPEKSWWFIPNRECVLMSGLFMIRLDERPNKMLQHGASMIQTLANEDTKARRKWLGVLDVSSIPASLKIDIHRDFEGFTLCEPSIFAIEGAQTFICPVELGFESFKRISVHESEPTSLMPRAPRPVPYSAHSKAEQEP